MNNDLLFTLSFSYTIKAGSLSFRIALYTKCPEHYESYRELALAFLFSRQGPALKANSAGSSDAGRLC